MQTERINRICGKITIVLSITGLLAVVSGYFQAPQSDEGTAAHIFQLSIVGLVIAILLFLGTADWKQPWRSTRWLVFPAVVSTLAFAALFYLEHYFYPGR